MRIEPFTPATHWYDRLRQERERRAFSRAELAGLANVSDETIFSYENRRRRPNRGTLLKLTRALDLADSCGAETLGRQALEELKKGKKKPEAVKGFLRGQVMKQTGGKANPELVNSDPLGEGWLIKVEAEGGVPESLLDEAAYQKLAESGGH